MATQKPHGVIRNPALPDRRTDYLFRVSLKCIIRNEQGEVLVVKEAGREFWDLPGGGMDHDEDIATSIARELKEEINFEGEFTYRVVNLDEPVFLERHGLWQLRLILVIETLNLSCSPGEDCDEIAFMNPSKFEDAAADVERRIYTYVSQLAP